MAHAPTGNCGKCGRLAELFAHRAWSSGSSYEAERRCRLCIYDAAQAATARAIIDYGAGMSATRIYQTLVGAPRLSVFLLPDGTEVADEEVGT